MLADQRQEALKTQELVQGHLNAMALRLGELQARMMRLDGLGERLAKVAGLQAAGIAVAASRARPRGAAAPNPSLPSRSLSVDEFSELLAKLGRQVEERSDQLGVLEALLVARLGQPQVHADARADRRRLVLVELRLPDRSVHRPAVVPRGHRLPGRHRHAGRRGGERQGRSSPAYQPQYGKIVEIDHGNGLVSRYAHASEVFVNEGDLVVRGQRVASVGSTGRSTGPHLHFEVRLNGVPQNPARFLRAPS